MRELLDLGNAIGQPEWQLEKHTRRHTKAGEQQSEGSLMNSYV
jgi:hypothetical protein